MPLLTSGPPQPQPPPLPAAEPSRSSYLLAHWRGEFGLGYAFFFHLVVLGAAPLALLFVALGPSQLWEPRRGLLCPCLLWPLALLILTWQLVGVYRSAQRAVRRQRGQATLPVLVIGLVAIAGATALAAAAFLGWPQVMRSVQALSGSPQLPPTSILVIGNGATVEFDGGIRLGCAQELERTLAKAPRATTLSLHSQGGLESEAGAMAECVRRHGLDTFVRKECGGAAVYVFLAGRERLVTQEAQFPFRNERSPALAALVGGDRLLREMQTLGASEEFLALAGFYPRTEPFVPSARELVNQHLATRMVDVLDYPLDAADLASMDEAWVRDYACRDELTAAYAEGDPASFSGLARDSAKRLKDGAALGEVMKGIHAKVAAALKEAVPSYAAIDKDIEWAIALLSYNKDYTPKEALMLFYHLPETRQWDREYILHHVAHYPFDGERALQIALLRDPRDPAGPAVSGSREEILRIARKYCADEREFLVLKSGIPRGLRDQQTVAGIWASTLVEIHAKPEEDRWALEAYLCTGYSR